MAGYPNVSQGTLNRILGSFICPNYPALNVTSPYLGERAISIAPQGGITTRLPQLTGVVTSPEPYVDCSITINLIRSQALADTWRTQMEALSLIGDCTVRPDATALDSFSFLNVSIQTVEAMTFNGKDAGFVVTCAGLWIINNDLWSAI